MMVVSENDNGSVTVYELNEKFILTITFIYDGC